jgi:NAD(P)-dependent dehydrogenase (short-subunit alcohol dehydrogenase family)
MHGLIHWLAGTYARKGITVNGVAPALIGTTKMLPGDSQELAKSKSNYPITCPRIPKRGPELPLKRDEKDHFGLASPRPLIQLMLTPAQEYH